MIGADERGNGHGVEAKRGRRGEGDREGEVGETSVRAYKVEVEEAGEAAALEEDVVGVEVAVDECVGEVVVAEAVEFVDTRLAPARDPGGESRRTDGGEQLMPLEPIDRRLTGYRPSDG